MSLRVDERRQRGIDRTGSSIAVQYVWRPDRVVCLCGVVCRASRRGVASVLAVAFCDALSSLVPSVDRDRFALSALPVRV